MKEVFPNKDSGMFITVEGIDGSGKSSHIPAMRQYFESNGYEVVTTREPGGTELAEKIRDMVLHARMEMFTESLLFFASRNEHLEKVIRPALGRGAIVICDRFTDSSIAFQCGARGLDERKVLALAALVHGDLWPDKTLIFDIDPAVAAERMQGRVLDKFELEEHAFHARARSRYRQPLPANHRITLVDASRSIEDVRDTVLTICSEWRSDLEYGDTNRHPRTNV